MTTKRKIEWDKSGFGAIEMIVTVCAVALLSLISLYVWHKGHQQTHQQPSGSTQKQSQQANNNLTESKLADLPPDLRDFIIAEAKTTNPECSADMQNNSFVKTDGSVLTASAPVIGYTADKFAYTVIGCSPSNTTALYVKERGAWKVVDTYGNGEAFKCSVLEKYKSPIKLLEGQATRLCTFGTDNSKVGTYDGRSVSSLDPTPIGQ